MKAFFSRVPLVGRLIEKPVEGDIDPLIKLIRNNTGLQINTKQLEGLAKLYVDKQGKLSGHDLYNYLKACGLKNLPQRQWSQEILDALAEKAPDIKRSNDQIPKPIPIGAIALPSKTKTAIDMLNPLSELVDGNQRELFTSFKNSFLQAAAQGKPVVCPDPVSESLTQSNIENPACFYSTFFSSFDGKSVRCTDAYVRLQEDFVLAWQSSRDNPLSSIILASFCIKEGKHAYDHALDSSSSDKKLYNLVNYRIALQTRRNGDNVEADSILHEHAKKYLATIVHWEAVGYTEFLNFLARHGINSKTLESKNYKDLPEPLKDFLGIFAPRVELFKDKIDLDDVKRHLAKNLHCYFSNDEARIAAQVVAVYSNSIDLSHEERFNRGMYSFLFDPKCF